MLFGGTNYEFNPIVVKDLLDKYQYASEYRPTTGSFGPSGLSGLLVREGNTNNFVIALRGSEMGIDGFSQDWFERIKLLWGSDLHLYNVSNIYV